MQHSDPITIVGMDSRLFCRSSGDSNQQHLVFGPDAERVAEPFAFSSCLAGQVSSEC